MKEMKRTRISYGGYLPLELNPGKEKFAEYEKNTLKFNCVKAALAYLIDQISPKRVWIPYYYCPSTTEAVKKMGIELSFYHIDKDLLPFDLLDEMDSMVILVDYFGVRNQQIKELAESFRKAVVVIDYAHAFYAEPVFRDDIYNVYSAKKFFGVPDGAYIIGAQISAEQSEKGYSYPYAAYLLEAYEMGTNYAYSAKKLADQSISENYGPISKLAVGLLKNIDYAWAEKQRKENYTFLHKKLGGINDLEVPETCAAYQYPLLLKGRGRQLKKELVTNKIYVPDLWKGHDLINHGWEDELTLSDHTVFLPVDQRYREQDMEYIAEKVRTLL